MIDVSKIVFEAATTKAQIAALYLPAELEDSLQHADCLAIFVIVNGEHTRMVFIIKEGTVPSMGHLQTVMFNMIASLIEQGMITDDHVDFIIGSLTDAALAAAETKTLH